MKRLGILCLGLALAGCSAEPQFDGHSADYWIGQLKSPDHLQRARAIHFVGQMGPRGKALIPELITMLKDPRPVVRHQAAFALAMFGEDSREAIPLLMEMSREDQNSGVRGAAEEALKKIAPANSPRQAGST
jgi:HEAT repeat protein